MCRVNAYRKVKEEEVRKIKMEFRKYFIDILGEDPSVLLN